VTTPMTHIGGNEGYRRVLWVVLAINAVMFAVEVAAGVAAGSASLQADALDFLLMVEITPSAFSWSARRFVIEPWQPFSKEPLWAYLACGSWESRRGMCGMQRCPTR
jgi:hypothetical protein